MLDKISGANFFSALDLASGYWQIPVSPSSIDKLAFVTPDGQYEWLRMPFGVCNGPAVFQRMMNSVLLSDPKGKAFAYPDDVLIPSRDIEEGFKNLEETFKLLQENNLTLRLSKCKFLSTKLTYLGHDLENGELRPSEDKIRTVKEFPFPKDVHTTRQFLGLASYFRKFIKNFSVTASPITQLLHNGEKFIWGKEQEQAFQELKTKLLERPILAIFDSDARTE